MNMIVSSLEAAVKPEQSFYSDFKYLTAAGWFIYYIPLHIVKYICEPSEYLAAIMHTDRPEL